MNVTHGPGPKTTARKAVPQKKTATPNAKVAPKPAKATPKADEDCYLPSSYHPEMSHSDRHDRWNADIRELDRKNAERIRAEKVRQQAEEEAKKNWLEKAWDGICDWFSSSPNSTSKGSSSNGKSEWKWTVEDQNRRNMEAILYAD